MNRTAELSQARAFHGLSEVDCQIWFGVSRATMERLEAGELEPSEELEERISRFLNSVGQGGSLSLAATPGRPSARPVGPTGGEAGLPPGLSADLSMPGPQ